MIIYYSTCSTVHCTLRTS